MLKSLFIAKMKNICTLSKEETKIRFILMLGKKAIPDKFKICLKVKMSLIKLICSILTFTPLPIFTTNSISIGHLLFLNSYKEFIVWMVAPVFCYQVSEGISIRLDSRYTSCEHIHFLFNQALNFLQSTFLYSNKWKKLHLPNPSFLGSFAKLKLDCWGGFPNLLILWKLPLLPLNKLFSPFINS